DIDAYLDATAGSVLRLAMAICGDAPAQSETFASTVGRAWGYAGLLRSLQFWTARGRSFFPRMLTSEKGKAMMIERAGEAHRRAREIAPSLPSALFAAIGYTALTPRYLKALADGRNELPLFSRQLTLLVSSATGRI